MEVLTPIILLFFLAYLIFSTYKYIQKQAAADNEHRQQDKQHDQLSGAAHSRSEHRDSE